jgi:hypothetical protein
MEALAEAGTGQKASAAFWEALADAADQMHLHDQASDYRQRASVST